MRNQRVARELGGAWCQADRAWLVFSFWVQGARKIGEMMFFFFHFVLVKVVSGIFVDLFLQIQPHPLPARRKDMGDLVLD